VMAEWAYLWLQKQHLHGIDRVEAIRYILEGAATKSDTSTKVGVIEVALTKAKVAAGELPADFPTTSAYRRSLTAEERQEQKMHSEAAQKNVQDSVHMDAVLERQLHNNVAHLELARDVAAEHRQLVSMPLFD